MQNRWARTAGNAPPKLTAFGTVVKDIGKKLTAIGAAVAAPMLDCRRNVYRRRSRQFLQLELADRPVLERHRQQIDPEFVS